MVLPMDNILAKLRLRKTKLRLTPFANKPSEAKRLPSRSTKLSNRRFWSPVAEESVFRNEACFSWGKQAMV